MTPLYLPDAFNLTGRTAVVTGAAGLLGTEHTHALAEVGASVVLTDIDVVAARVAADEINGRGLPGKVLALPLDVADEESIRAVVGAATEQFGGVDILVNNAALDPKVRSTGLAEPSRLEAFGLEQWHREIEVGLTGAFLCSRVIGTHMASRGKGVILNIASDLSVIAPDQRLYRRRDLPDDRQPVKPVTYSVIKAGLVGLTRYLSSYWADRGVRANALSPGGVFNQQPDEFVARLSQLIPLGRMARRDEYRAVVQFLCSDASSYMTGQNVICDGGRTVL